MVRRVVRVLRNRLACLGFLRLVAIRAAAATGTARVIATLAHGETCRITLIVA